MSGNAAVDVLAKTVFGLFEAWPRFKDIVYDELSAGASGALVLRGPLKMIQTIAMITQRGKATTTAERFKPLVSKSAWHAAGDALKTALEGVEGQEGLAERISELKANQFVCVIVFELEDGELRCQHNTGSGVASVEDRGPWEYVLDHGRSRTSERPAFNYNGSLVPYRVSPDRPLKENIPRPDYYEDGQADAERRSEARNTPPVHTEKQIKKMRKANLLGREILDAAHRIVKPGVTTDEIDRVVHDYTVEHGAYPAPLHYFDFPKSVCTSVNEVVCHGIPDLRELQDGDIVNVDVSAVLDGYHTDLNETFIVGKNVSKEKKALIKATHDSLFKAIDQCKPGTFYRDIGGVITKHINGCGFSVDKTYCGHGIGEFFHCAPNIPHCTHAPHHTHGRAIPLTLLFSLFHCADAGNKAKFVMKPGHIFTIEPMVNMGSWKDTHWLDGWTAVTKDGLPSAQFEHTLLVTETGCEILTKRLETSPPLWWEAEAAESGAAASSAPPVPIDDPD